MAISEAARSDLYTGLSQVLGPDRAEILMSAIPLHDLDQVATKGDLAVLSGELRSEIADLRSDMADLRTQLKTDIAELRAALRTELSSEIGGLRRSMTNWMLTLLVAIVGAMVSTAFIP